MGPKYVFGLIFILLNFVFVFLLLKNWGPSSPLDVTLYSLFIPLNFLVIGAVFLFGNNDALVAGLIGFGALARLRGLLRISGILFGAAILLKFYPLLLLLFLVLGGQRRFLMRPFLWAVGTLLVGALLTYIRWGSSVLNAVNEGVSRDATILSILNFARETGIDRNLYEWLVTWNSVGVVLATIVLLVLCLRYRVNWLVASALAMLLLAMLYKVGHQQFLLTWLVLLATILVAKIRSGQFMLYVSIPLATFLSVYQFLFVRSWNSGAFGEPDGYLLRVLSSPPFFLAALGVILLSLFDLRRNSKTKGRPPAESNRES